MSIRLSADEAWDAVEAAHTGIMTTLRSDGSPITLPVWFVVENQTICVSTPPATKKVRRVRRDPRASFLVESGKAWRELAAVHLSGRIHEVEDHAERALLKAALDAKYATFKTAATAMSPDARQAYAQYTILRLVPEGRILSWDNGRLNMPDN